MKRLSKTFKSKKLFITILAFVLFAGITVYAAQIGSEFSFEMNRAVYGSTKYSLSNKSTTVKTTASTYSYATESTTTAQGYKIALTGTSYKTAGNADGTTKTVNFGTLSAGTYKVNLLVTNPQAAGTVSWYIKGTGTVNQ